jgi:hypothetical protein
MNRIILILGFVCFQFLFSILNAQELNQRVTSDTIRKAQDLIEQMKLDTLYESSKVNPEPERAYIHVSSQIPNLQFDSNRKIEKVNKLSSGDWEVWLPGGTHILKIDAVGYQRLELEARQFAKKRSYEMRIKAIHKSEYVLDTDPSSAAVSIDGQDAGMTPLKAVLEYGEHLIKIKKLTYEDVSYKVNIAEPRVAENKKLIKQKGILALDTDPTNIKVIIDDREALMTPCDISLDVGEHTISIREDNYEDVAKVIDIPNSKLIQKIPLKNRQALYRLETDPAYASVKVDGEDYGKTPFSKSLSLGKHHINVELLNYDDVSYDITINKNGWQENRKLARYYTHELELGIGGAMPFEKNITMDSTMNSYSVGTAWSLWFKYHYNINSHLALGIYYSLYELQLKNIAYIENGSKILGDIDESHNHMGVEARWTLYRGGLEPSCYLLAGGFFGGMTPLSDLSHEINSFSGISFGLGFRLSTSISDHIILSADIVGFLGTASWGKQINPYSNETKYNPASIMYTISISNRYGEH